MPTLVGKESTPAKAWSPRASANYAAMLALVASGIPILFGMSVTTAALFAVPLVIAVGALARRFPVRGFPVRLQIACALGAWGWMRLALGPDWNFWTIGPFLAIVTIVWIFKLVLGHEGDGWSGG